ncbi:MAG: DUF4316 domain-containing protein [Oscillospiraceae bacterium]
MEQYQDKKKNNEPRLKLEDDVSFMNEQSVASATECTGLTPSLPLTEDEAESYSNIYPVPAPKPAEYVQIRRKPLRHSKSDGKRR